MSAAPRIILGVLIVLAVSVVVLALFLAAARAGSRSEREQRIAEQAARQRGRDIAHRIRAELVCCDIYDRVNDRSELTFEQAQASSRWHDLCYWGEASAQLAEGRCPGYETTPNICQCACPGCASSCDAHIPEDDQ